MAAPSYSPRVQRTGRAGFHVTSCKIETVAQDLQRLGARGDETIYIHEDIGMKTEMAGIHERVGTIDALCFYFDEEGYYISAD